MPDVYRGIARAEDQFGTKKLGAVVKIVAAGTDNPEITPYLQDGVTVIPANQRRTDSSGVFEFYAPIGDYDAIITKNGVTVRQKDVMSPGAAVAATEQIRDEARASADQAGGIVRFDRATLEAALTTDDIGKVGTAVVDETNGDVRTAYDIIDSGGGVPALDVAGRVAVDVVQRVTGAVGRVGSLPELVLFPTTDGAGNARAITYLGDVYTYSTDDQSSVISALPSGDKLYAHAPASDPTGASGAWIISLDAPAPIELFGGGAGDNADAVAAARSILGTGAVVTVSDPTGTYEFGGGLDYSAFAELVWDVPTGVVFQFASYPGYLSQFANIECVRPIRCYSDDADFYFTLTTATRARPTVDLGDFLNSSDYDPKKLRALTVNSGTSAKKVAWPSGDWDDFATSSSVSFPDANTARISVTTADENFHVATRNIAAGVERRFRFSAQTGAPLLVVLVRGTAGYSGMYFDTTQPVTNWDTFRKNDGVSAETAAVGFVARGTHGSYAPYFSVIGVKVVEYDSDADETTFTMTVNGVVALISTVAGQAVEAGAGIYSSVDGQGVDVVDWIDVSDAPQPVDHVLHPLIIGDSKSAPRNNDWPDWLSRTLDLSGNTRVAALSNYAVAGQTSAQQLTKLQSEGVPVSPIGVTDCIIDVGTNDVQGGISAATFLSNVASIISEVQAVNPSVRVHLCNFSLWYGTAQNNGTGQATSNYEQGAAHRSGLQRLAALSGYNLIDWCDVAGLIFSGFDNPSAGVTDLTYAESVMQDSIHPSARLARLQAYHAARAILGYAAPQPTRAIGWMEADGFANGWSQGAESVQWRRDADGWVHLSGYANVGTTTDGTVICTLPQSVWPERTVRQLVAMDGGGSARIEISHTSGDVQIYDKSATGGTSFLFFDGMVPWRCADGTE